MSTGLGCEGKSQIHICDANRTSIELALDPLKPKVLTARLAAYKIPAHQIVH